MKGQVSIEFLASFFLYLLAVAAVIQFVSDDIPEFDDSMDSKIHHVEAKYVSDQVLTQSGYHTVGSGGSNWEKNTSTRKNVENFGLASDYLVIEQQKLQAVTTVGNSKFNYSQFVNTVGASNQYLFNFTWMPVVHTDEQFRKNNPPAGLTEPDHPLYDSAGMNVQYGRIRLNGHERHFLVTSHMSNYNTTYISSNRNFRNAQPQGTGHEIDFNGKQFSLIHIQNREYDKGGLLVLERHVKEFGATRDAASSSVKLNRYVSYKAQNSGLEPMRVEVYVW